ncbi:DUF4283 domain-containing protein [Abeliophyllum distichum]|uniref:DUF4283 domain-containing protein n=1 Tax=Abeliophyllum distichum TaxID=126358 RepID=A0ABD1TK14_9LAMI
MPEYIQFDDEEISLMLVWVVLPEFPLDCWTPKALSKIVSKIGKPISMNNLTHTTLVEVDAAKDLVRSVEVSQPNGKIFYQKVIFEHEPKFSTVEKSNVTPPHVPNSVPEVLPDVPVLVPNVLPDILAAAVIDKQNQPKTGVISSPNATQVSAENQRDCVDNEGEAPFILVERIKKNPAKQKRKQQVRGRQSTNVSTGISSWTGKVIAMMKLIRLKKISAILGQSSSSWNKLKGHSLPLSP